MYNLNGFFDAIGQPNPMRKRKRMQAQQMPNMDPAMATGFGAAMAAKPRQPGLPMDVGAGYAAAQFGQQQPPMGDMGMAAGWGAAQSVNRKNALMNNMQQAMPNMAQQPNPQQIQAAQQQYRDRMQQMISSRPPTMATQAIATRMGLQQPTQPPDSLSRLSNAWLNNQRQTQAAAQPNWGAMGRPNNLTGIFNKVR